MVNIRKKDFSEDGVACWIMISVRFIFLAYNIYTSSVLFWRLARAHFKFLTSDTPYFDLINHYLQYNNKAINTFKNYPLRKTYSTFQNTELYI